MIAHADMGMDAPIPLPNVSANILSKVIEYCKFHIEAEKQVDDKPVKTKEEIKSWDTDFVALDQSTLFELILVKMDDKFHMVRALLLSRFLSLQAANYLNIKSLLDWTCLTVANMIKGK